MDLAKFEFYLKNKCNIACDGVAGSGKTTHALNMCLKLPMNSKISYLHSSSVAACCAERKFKALLNTSTCAFATPTPRFESALSWISRASLSSIIDPDEHFIQSGFHLQWLPNLLILDDAHFMTRSELSTIKKILEMCEASVQMVILFDSNVEGKKEEYEQIFWKFCCSSRGWTFLNFKYSLRCSSAVCNLVNANTSFVIQPMQTTINMNYVLHQIDLKSTSQVYDLIKDVLNSECAILYSHEFKGLKRICMDVINVAICNDPTLRVHSRSAGELSFSPESARGKLLIWPIEQFHGIKKQRVVLISPQNVSESDVYQACTRAECEFIWIQHNFNLNKVSKKYAVSSLCSKMRHDQAKWKSLISFQSCQGINLLANFQTHFEDLSFIYGAAIMLCAEYIFTKQLRSIHYFLYPKFDQQEHSEISSLPSSDAPQKFSSYAKTYFYSRISPEKHKEAIELASSDTTTFCDIFHIACSFLAFHEHQGIVKQLDTFEWFQPDAVEKAISTLRFVLEEHFACNLKEGSFEHPFSYGKIKGRCDLYFEGELCCEVKFTHQLTESHRIQAMIYASIATVQTQQPHQTLIINLRNSEAYSCLITLNDAYQILSKCLQCAVD